MMLMWQPGIIFGGYLKTLASRKHSKDSDIRIVVDLDLREEGELVRSETELYVAVAVS